MIPADFVRWVEGYYGDYRPVVKAEVLHWLAERTPHFIAGLRERVRDEYSNQYRMPPDIAILNQYRNQETYDRGRAAMQLEADKKPPVKALLV